MVRLVGFCLSVFILSSGAALYAQDASVIGSVTDDTKAMLPGATITATSLETGVQQVAVSDANGQYRLRLPPGSYKLQAELSGFGPVLLPRVELLVGQNANVPITLKLAQLTETLTVTGESPLVDTTSSQVAGNVDRRQMESLPLQGRNWMELSKMVKGITANDVSNNRPGVDADDMFQLNLDGQQITQKIAGSGFGQPRFSARVDRRVPDRHQHVRHHAGPLGRHPGAGDLEVGHELERRQLLRLLPQRQAERGRPGGEDRAAVSNQQVGGTFGGPIVRDKLHYFASYEYEREPGTIFTQPAALPGQSFTIAVQELAEELARPRRRSAVGEQPAVGAGVAVGLGQPVRPRRRRPSLDRLGSDEGIDQRPRLLVDVCSAKRRMVQEVKVGYNDFHWTNAPQPSMVGTPRVQLPRADDRRAVQLSAVPHQQHLERALRPELAQGEARLQDRRRVHARARHRRWYIQAVGRYTMTSRAVEPRAAGSGRAPRSTRRSGTWQA